MNQSMNTQLMQIETNKQKDTNLNENSEENVR